MRVKKLGVTHAVIWPYGKGMYGEVVLGGRE
jgi:hypothetical protein